MRRVKTFWIWSRQDETETYSENVLDLRHCRDTGVSRHETKAKTIIHYAFTKHTLQDQCPF